MRTLVVALLCIAANARADTILDVQAGLLFDSNLPRAQLDRDIKSDTALQASLAWGRFVPLANGLTLRATLDAAGELYAHYGALDNVAVGTSLGLRRKFGLGALAPWIGASASAARLEYRSALRDGWRYELGFNAGKRLAAPWTVEAGYRYDHRTADKEVAVVPGISGAVFDLQSHRVELKSEYALTDRIALAAGYDVRRGDIASTTLRNFNIFTHSDAIALDPAFGAETVGYRIQAVTRAYRLGVGYALGSANSVNFVAERWVSRARAGLDYYNTLVGVSYVHAL
jgi:hypothetical protein